jgi:hypothetical protein
MSVPIYITVTAPTGKSLWARVRKPDATLGAEGALTETPAGSMVYQATLTPTLADTTAAGPCDKEVREATDATSFNASTIVWGPRTKFWVENGQETSEPTLLKLDAAVSSVSGGGSGTTVNQSETINEVDERIQQ